MSVCRIVAPLLLAAFAASAFSATYDVGSGQPYPTLASLPTLGAGDVVNVHAGTYNEVKRWTSSGTAASPITIRGVGVARSVIDASGYTVDGLLPNPRAVFQIEGSHYVIQHLEFCNARNGNNGSGMRFVTCDDVTVRDCRVHDNDMGMQSNGNDHLVIDSCEVDHNGTSLYADFSHNFYLIGNGTTVRGCYIHDAVEGQNFKSRGHYTELLYNWIADSNEGEVVLVDDGTMTTSANSNAVMIGNVVISKVRPSGSNGVNFIEFGADSGAAHTGTLYAFNNTFIAGTTRICFLWSSQASASIVAWNNVFSGSDKLINTGSVGPISGGDNWAQSTAVVPASFTGTVLGASPLFADAVNRDFHLTSGSPCRDIGSGSLTSYDGAGAAHSGVPTLTYEGLGSLVARASDGHLDAGAYELAAAATAPTITGQPANQTVTAGQTATFSVAASGTGPLSYQWQRGGANIGGAISSSYTTLVTTTADNGATFRCLVSNSAGSATSNPATLTVNAAAVAPTITGQPANQTVTAGQTATFGVTASGTAPLSYQWQRNGANIGAATSSSYITPATTTADNGATFRCLVSNSAGSATSNPATLTVNGGAGIDTVWVEDAIPAGGASVADGGDAWTWIGANPSPFAGALCQQSAIAAGEHQHYFTGATQTLAIAAGDALFAYVYLDPANPPDEIMLQWNDGSWEHRAYWGANSLSWGVDGTVSKCAMGALPVAGQWVRLEVAANQVGLEGATLNGMAFTLSGGRVWFDHAGKRGVATPPAITTQPVSQSVTAGQTATFTVAASGTGPLSYQWQRGTANISGATSSSYTTPATTTADNGVTFRCLVSNSVGSATSSAATLTVNAAATAPAITTQPASQSVTAGQTATFTVAASGTGPLSYQWQIGTANISGATSSSYTTPATTTADNGVTFRCVVSNSVGAATSNPATLTVTAAGGSLPAGWSTSDIGSVGAAGSASAANGTWTVQGAGADISGKADAFRFADQSLSGDGQIVAHVVSVANTDPWAKAGIMIRETATAGSRYAMIALTPANGIISQRRTSTSGQTRTTSGAHVSAPYWLKLTRVGSTFSAYQSADGVTWQLVSNQSITMASGVLVGLAVTSRSSGALCTAVFDNVVVTAGPVGSG